MAFFQELGASKWHLVESVGPSHKRFGVWRVELPELREALTRAFRRAVSKSQCSRLSCWCSLGQRSSELMGDSEVQKTRKMLGAWWKDGLLNYFSSDKKRLGSLWGGEPGVFIRSLSLEDVASDKRRRDCYFLCGAFKRSAERLDCWFWKGRSWLVWWSQECFLAQLFQVYLVAVEQLQALLTSTTIPLESPDASLSMLTAML